jgi:hypothetical protein
MSVPVGRTLEQRVVLRRARMTAFAGVVVTVLTFLLFCPVIPGSVWSWSTDTWIDPRSGALPKTLVLLCGVQALLTLAVTLVGSSTGFARLVWGVAAVAAAVGLIVLITQQGGAFRFSQSVSPYGSWASAGTLGVGLALAFILGAVALRLTDQSRYRR